MLLFAEVWTKELASKNALESRGGKFLYQKNRADLKKSLANMNKLCYIGYCCNGIVLFFGTIRMFPVNELYELVVKSGQNPLFNFEKDG